MRVAIVSAEVAPFVGGGIAPAVLGTAQVLAAAGHHVDLFTRAGYRVQAATADAGQSVAFRHPRIQWHWVPEPDGTADDWHTAMAHNFDRALSEAFTSIKPDLVELHDYQGLGAVVASERGGGRLSDVLVATRLHTSAELLGEIDRFPCDPQVATLERVGLMASDLLLAPSEQSIDRYRAFYDALPLPPSEALWPGYLRAAGTTVAPAATDGDRLRLIAVGRLQRCKGTDLLVEALVGAPELPIDLMLLGGDTQTGPSGSMRDYVAGLSAGDTRIVLQPPVPRGDVNQYLERADALVVASVWEMWNIAGLEALGAARPVLTTPLASLIEMTDDERYGLVAEGHDRDHISELLHRAWDQRGRLKALGGTPELPAHLARLTSDRDVAAGYEALVDLSARTPRKSFSGWQAVADAGSSTG